MSGGLIGPMQTGETWVLQPRLLRVREQNNSRSGTVRMQERFAGVNGDGVKSLLQNFSPPNDSLPFVKCFFEAYPLAAEQLLAAEGGRSLLFSNFATTRAEASQVPFIPVLDAIRYGSRRWVLTCEYPMCRLMSMLSGFSVGCRWVFHVFHQESVSFKVAAKWSMVKDEPVKDLLATSTRPLSSDFLNANTVCCPRVDRSFNIQSWPVVKHSKLTGRSTQSTLFYCSKKRKVSKQGMQQKEVVERSFNIHRWPVVQHNQHFFTVAKRKSE